MFSPGVASIFVFILVEVGQAASGFLVCMHSAYMNTALMVDKKITGT